MDEPGSLNETIWYQDLDTDGYGVTAISASSCNAPAGFTLNDGDCDDNDTLQRPGAAEYCNEEDDVPQGTLS